MITPATVRALPKEAVLRLQRGLGRPRGLAWGLVLPTVLLLLLVGIVPTLYTIALAFTRATPGGPLLALEFVGVQNFALIFGDLRFWQSLRVSACFVFLSVGVQLVLGLIAALAFQRVHPLIERIGMTLVLVPMMMVPAVVGLMWRLILNETYGPLNYLLGLAGLPQPTWGSSAGAALTGLLIADIWEWTPFVIILLLAGLQSLPQEIYEAAQVDGATASDTFWRITLPLLKPFIFLALFLRMVDAWKAFDLVATLTQGGPGNTTESIGYYTWKVGFGVSGERNLAAAISLFQLVVIIVIGRALLRQLRRVGQDG
jgi:multiple sugar transport system permease protein